MSDAGRFLVQDHAVEVAPGAAYFLHARQRWRSLANGEASALVMGDPRVDTRLFPGLPALPGAAEEARRVAALYSDSNLATGEAATREALLTAIGGHAVVHLATHALVDNDVPMRSALALAPRRMGDGSGALFAAEIRRLTLPRTRTVVLAACGTRAPLAGIEGRLSLARAFLAADVPTVVAALWPVGDQRSVALLTAFHARLSAGDDPAIALRSAQVRLLSSPDPVSRSPATWALFQAMGG